MDELKYAALEPSELRMLEALKMFIEDDEAAELKDAQPLPLPEEEWS